MSRPPESRRRRRQGLVLLVLLSLGLVTVHALVGDAPLGVRLLGALPGVAALAAIWRYVADRRFGRMPFLEYALVQAYIYWGMPTITGTLERSPPVRPSAVYAAMVGINLFLLGVLLLYPAGNLVGRRLRRVLERALPATVGPGVALFLVPWLLLTMAVSGGLEHVLPRSLQYAVHLLGSGYPLIALAFVLSVRPSGDKRRAAILLPATTAVVAISGLPTGMLGAAARPMVAGGVLAARLRRAIPWRWLAVLAIAVVILNPAKHLFRSEVWTDRKQTIAGPWEAATTWTSAVAEAWDGHGTAGDNVEALLDRLNNLTWVARAFDWTPEIVPYDYGQKWLLLPYALVPRVVDPSKPDMKAQFNDRYNQTFGFQSSTSAESTTLAFPIVADGYWNFGWLGVGLVAILMGLLIGIYAELSRTENWGLLSLTLALQADFNITPHVMAQVGGLFQLLLATAIITWGAAFLTYGLRPRRRGTRRPDATVGARPAGGALGGHLLAKQLKR